MTTTFTATTPADFDGDIADISGGADSATNTAFTIALASGIATDQTNTLTLPSGSSLELDGPGALTVTTGEFLGVTTASGTAGALKLDTGVTGDSFVGGQPPAATIVLNGAALVNGASAALHSGANQMLSGSVLGQSTADSVDNFGQIDASIAAATTAVFLAGGSVINEATGTIQGGLAGVVFSAAGTVTNSGTITGVNNGYGVYFEDAGTVINGPGNATAAVLQGANAGVLVTGAATITNDASILSTGTTGAGVAMASGTVDNGLNSGASAMIEGGQFGVEVTSGNATITNLGTIEATEASGQPPSGGLVAGVSLAGGGTLYNGVTASFAVNSAAVTSGADYGVLVTNAQAAVRNSGTIRGNVAISFNSVAGTVVDNGAITSTAGANGTAIQFAGGQSTLQLFSGYTITGKVEGGTANGSTNTLELTTNAGFSGLAAGSGAVSSGFAFDHFDTIQIDTGEVASFSGVNAATNLVIGGEADVADGGSLEITGAATGNGTISLGADSGLVIDSSANFTGDTIAQFMTGDSIDLTDVAFASLSKSFSNNQLQLGDGTHTADLTFTSGFTSLANFSFAVDSGSGTVVTVACYCPGTRIATPQGEVAVEALAIGDVVSTADGRAEPIRWIGRRSYAGRFVLANPKVQPVRVRAGALGSGLPWRDLLVSPEHAMLLDGMLIPARCLVDGVQIVAERGWTAVDYIHIELASHEAILAEGAASETFIDDDSRAMFQNAGEYTALYPDARPAGSFCAPRVEDGYELEAIRQRLAGVAIGFAEAA